MNEEILLQIKGGLVVSCQALKEEPLCSPYIMSRMAYAAKLGGAVGIRANYTEDIIEIKKMVSLPVIGIIKENYEDCLVYITPTMKEVDALVEVGTEIIATDATRRMRPDGITLEIFFKEVRERYPRQLFMADCSDFEEGMYAASLGFDIISTTMNGYTEYTTGSSLPNYELMKSLVRECGKPVIAEGGIWTPEQLKQVFETGIHAAVVGTAITRPMEITKRFVDSIGKAQVAE